METPKEINLPAITSLTHTTTDGQETVVVPAGGMLVAVNRYIAIGINNEFRKAILAAADYTEVGCEMLATERQENKEMPYKISKVFMWGQHTETLIRDWLKSWGWSGQQARTTWRDIHGHMTALIHDEVKKHKRGDDVMFPKATPMSKEKQRAFARAKGRRSKAGV